MGVSAMMMKENINHAFLNRVLDGSLADFYYHFGLSSNDPLLEQMRGVRAIITAGSGMRIREFTEHWSTLNGDAEILAFPKDDRFIARYTAGILFASHGMGMPSASIALQELMRILYFLKSGNLVEMDKVFWARVGTSGGVGLPAGTVVVSTEGLMADLKPYRLLKGVNGEYWFDGNFPAKTCQEIIMANADSGLNIVSGKTVAGNDFFLEQFRLDGAISFETPETRMAWLQLLFDKGVRNIEMEGAMFAGYLNHWGFSRFAMICATLLNRFEGDQVTSTPKQLHRFSQKAGAALFNYLKTFLLEQIKVLTPAVNEKTKAVEPDWEKLRQAALAALKNSYSPYSLLPVGVAGFTEKDRLVWGANIENASYGLTLCAECSMISHLCSTGGGRLTAVYCVDADGQPLMPCGRCRQLLYEHGGPEMLLMTPQGVRTMADVLPQAFGPIDLEDR
jgi:uridine phosphorylase/homotetrameric cytidine deaminase